MGIFVGILVILGAFPEIYRHILGLCVSVIETFAEAYRGVL